MPKPVSKIDRYVIQKVIKRRKQLNMTQADLAHSLEIAPSFVQAVESETTAKRYSLDRINELARALKCSVHDLIPRDPL
jgi:transcriptional regulator with XRE-family HTH domain